MEIEILVRNALTEAVVGWYEFKAIYLPCGVVDLAVTALQLWAFPQEWNMEWLTQPLSVLGGPRKELLEFPCSLTWQSVL